MSESPSPHPLKRPSAFHNRSALGVNPGAVSDDFHTDATEWDTDLVSWYYDGVKYSIDSRSDVGAKKWAFDQPFFTILNLAVGGQLPGPVGLKTVFPAQFLVDDVRVYEKAP